MPPAQWKPFRSVRLLAADRLADESGKGYLATAAGSWLHEPVLRGIGQSYAKATVRA